MDVVVARVVVLARGMQRHVVGDAERVEILDEVLHHAQPLLAGRLVWQLRDDAVLDA